MKSTLPLLLGALSLALTACNPTGTAGAIGGAKPNAGPAPVVAPVANQCPECTKTMPHFVGQTGTAVTPVVVPNP